MVTHSVQLQSNLSQAEDRDTNKCQQPDAHLWTTSVPLRSIHDPFGVVRNEELNLPPL